MIFSITSFHLVSTKASSGVMENVTLDEALVETRQKLLIEKIIGSILEKMMTFGHIYDYK